jgi:glycosyltransferase involved in cell wall biosynthesis
MTKKIHIAHVISNLEQDDGIQNVIDSLSHEYDFAKYKMIIFVLSMNDERKDFYEKRGIKVFRIKISSQFSFKNFLKGFFVVYSLIKLFKKERIEIVTSHDFFCGIFGRIAAVLARIPVNLWMVHNEDHWKKTHHIMVDKFLANFSDIIITNSHYIKKRNSKIENISIEKHFVIHNGINLKKFNKINNKKSIREELGLSKESPIITNIGRLVTQKGQKYLLEASVEVIKKHPKTAFLIVGDEGDHRDGNVKLDLMNFIEMNKLSKNIFFLGRREDIPKILNETDLFVFPTLWEGFGLVIAEAMAMEVPVIASNIGPIPEIIKHNESGVLVEPKKSKELSIAILDLLQNKEKRRSIAAKGKERVFLKFSAKVMATKTENLYQELLEKKKNYDEL